MGNIVDTVEDRIQNAFLTARDSIITPKIESAIKSINASSGRDATTVMANSERGEHIGNTSPFENLSERNNALHVLNTNDETRNNIPDEVSDMSVPGTHFDRQPHTHHSSTFCCLAWWNLFRLFSSFFGIIACIFLKTVAFDQQLGFLFFAANSWQLFCISLLARIFR